jgi:hypothetical protein
MLKVMICVKKLYNIYLNRANWASASCWKLWVKSRLRNGTFPVGSNDHL